MTPDRGCDHVDGSPMGMCAVCGKTVCSECYTTVFNEMICDEHESLEDESAWELVAIYTDPAVVADKRFQLEENGISSISVQSEEDAVELYVPAEEKDEGFAVLQSAGDDIGVCAAVPDPVLDRARRVSALRREAYGAGRRSRDRVTHRKVDP